MGFAVGGVRALRPCGAAFVKKRTSELFSVETAIPTREAHERGGTGRGRRTTVNRPGACVGRPGGWHRGACGAACTGAAWAPSQRPSPAGAHSGRRHSGRATGRVGRPFDAAPPGLNRGAGLVPGAQEAGRWRRRRRRRAATGRPGSGLACRRKLEKGSRANPVAGFQFPRLPAFAGPWGQFRLLGAGYLGTPFSQVSLDLAGRFA